MRTLHVRIGDRVDVGGSRGQGKVRIVGRAVLAPGIVNDQIDLGGGALFTIDGVRRLEDAPVTQYLVRVARRDRAATLAQLSRDFPLTVLTATNSAEVADLARVRWLPLTLAGLLALLSCGTVAHNLATSVRRRRRDLAVLKSLGFCRRQLRDVVRWQSGALVFAAAVIGAPLGVTAGRAAWATVEHRLAVVAPPVVPVLGLTLVVLGALAVANLAASLPARAAARIPAAEVFRSE